MGHTPRLRLLGHLPYCYQLQLWKLSLSLWPSKLLFGCLLCLLLYPSHILQLHSSIIPLLSLICPCLSFSILSLSLSLSQLLFSCMSYGYQLQLFNLFILITLTISATLPSCASLCPTVTSFIPLLYFNYTPLSSLSYLSYLVHPLSLICRCFSFFLACCLFFLLISCHPKSSHLILFHFISSLVPHHHSLFIHSFIIGSSSLVSVLGYYYLSSPILALCCPLTCPPLIFNSVPSGALWLTFTRSWLIFHRSWLTFTKSRLTIPTSQLTFTRLSLTFPRSQLTFFWVMAELRSGHGSITPYNRQIRLLLLLGHSWSFIGHGWHLLGHSWLSPAHTWLFLGRGSITPCNRQFRLLLVSRTGFL